MFTDIKGFSERTSSTSREGLVELLNRHDELLLPVVQRFGGEVVKTIGDALLATFESPTNAVLAGLLMQERLRQFNEDVSTDQQLHVRVAVNTGEVEERNDDIFGEAVNIAARIENIAEAGEVYFTESVYLAMNKTEVPTSSVGRFRLKGIPEQIQVYRVLRDPENAQYQALLTRLQSTKKHLGRAAAKRLANKQAASQLGNWRRGWALSLVALSCAVLIAVGYFWYVDPGNTQYRQARSLFEQQELDASAEAYQQLLKNEPVNWALHAEVVERFGAAEGRMAKVVAQQAMFAWLPELRRQSAELNTTQVHTLADTLFAAQPFSAETEALRHQLSNEKDQLAERMQAALGHKNPLQRLHAKLFLVVSGELTPLQEFEFHWRNMLELPYGYRRELLSAAEYFRTKPSQEYLSRVDVNAVPKALIWRSDNTVARELKSALLLAFPEQLSVLNTPTQSN